MTPRIRSASRLAAATAAGALLLAGPAVAVDGVLEINHVCASGPGCFPGDLPGYPVEIPNAGSYVLTGLLRPPPGVHGIFILRGAEPVAIDLNGFPIIGPGLCTDTGSAVNCPPGVGSGILVDPATPPRETTVLNGTVRGFPEVGIDLGDACRVEGVTVTDNTQAGLDLGSNCHAIRNRAERNGGTGINAGSACKVENNLANGNGGVGIEVLESCTVLANTARGNYGGGVFVAASSTVANNTAESNTLFGISGGLGNVARGNAVFGTRTDAAGVIGDGIRMGDLCTISDNASSSNSGQGITCGFGCTINGNESSRNDQDGIRAEGGSGISHNTASLNGGHGIECVSPAPPVGGPPSLGCGVTGNTAMLNQGNGLSFSTTPPAGSPPPRGIYRNNTLNQNASGDVSPAGLDPAAFQNTCSGAIPCP